MSDRNIRLYLRQFTPYLLIGLISFVLLSLSACGNSRSHGSGIAETEEAGIIMPRDSTDLAELRFVEATRQDMTSSMSMTAIPILPLRENLRFSGQEGSLTVLVQAGQYVKEGQVLAYLDFEATRLEIAYSAAALRLERFEVEFNQSRRAHLANIEEARNRAALMVSATAESNIIEVVENEWIGSSETLAENAPTDANDVSFDNYVPMAYDFTDGDGDTETYEEAAANDNSDSFGVTEPLSAATQELAYLELALLEIGYERFLLTSEITRAALSAEVSALRDVVYREYITAPFDGVITFVISPPYGLIWNPIIVTIVDFSVFFYQLNISVDHSVLNLYNQVRFGEIFTLRSTDQHYVDGAERPVLEFEARVVTDYWVSGHRNSFRYWLMPVDKEALFDDLRLLCEDDVHPFYTLLRFGFVISVDVVHAINGITLPVSAVSWDGSLRYVRIYNDGRLGKRYVQTGASTRGYIQILTGLDTGTKVVNLP